MLLGARANWTPAPTCVRVAEARPFDDPGLRRPAVVRDALGGRGATIAYDPAADADARRRVRAFLAQRVKGGAP
jgi:hypothetical protein